MVNNYQYPYSKIIRANGEVIPASDHNKQEHQLECITDALGNYNFSAGTIESRIASLSGGILTDISDLQSDVAALQTDVATLQTDLANLELNDLSDVSAASPSAGEVLTYVGSNWVPMPASTSLAGLSDVDLTGAAPGDSLVLSGTGGDWTPVDRRVLVASGAPGSMDESEVFPVSEIRFLSNSGTGEDNYVVEVSTGVAYIGGGPAPGALSTLSGLTGLVTGRLSTDGAATYPPAAVAGDSYSAITQNSTWAFNTDASEFGSASLGNLILAVNGSDVANIDLAANFEESNRVAGQNMANYNTTGTGDAIAAGVVTFVGGNLTLNSVGPYNSIPADSYQRGSATINLTSAALRTGYNIVTLRHVTTGTSTATLEWFYDVDADGDPNDPDVEATSLDLAENIPVLKFLSGVSYYDTGSTFNLDVVGNDLFDNVYHDSSNPLTVATTSSWGGSPTIAVTDGSVSGVSNPPAITEIMTVTNFALTVASGIQVADARATVTPRDPYASYTSQQTPSNGFSVMSDGPNSTDVFDDFTDERYRLPASTDFDAPISSTSWPPNIWDSTVSLLDGSRANELQVYDHDASPANRLTWPDYDYSNASAYQPQVNPDYSTLTGTVDRVYRRVFRSTGGSKTNGVITLPGIADSDLVSDIAIRFKVPGKTVWLDALTAFDGGTFPTGAPLVGGVDGEGCRINSGVNSPDINGSIEFSLGAIGTDLTSDYQLIIEITYVDPTTSEILGSGSGLSINW